MFTPALESVKSILCLGAHADDIEIGCGGTLLQLLAATSGIHVQWVVFSAAGDRKKEAIAGAEHFLAKAGSKDIIVKDFRDSFFPYEAAPIKEFVHQLANGSSPDLIFTHRQDDAHQDHRLLAELTRCAFRDHWILEYEIPKYEGDLGQPNLFIPIAPDHSDNKITTLLDVYTTQHQKHWFTEDTFRSLMRLRGVECNSVSRYAEAFHCRKTTIHIHTLDASKQRTISAATTTTSNSMPVSTNLIESPGIFPRDN